MTTLILIIFWLMQIVAALFFKYGSTAPARWLPCFLLGNLVGISSVYLMMKLYARMHPNVAMALAIGGAFLFSQIAMALIFKSKPMPIQWCGLMIITIGMAMSSFSGTK